MCEVDKKGRRSGDCNRFTKAGKLVEFTHYEKEILEGEYIRFSPLELPIIKGWYEAGKKNGIWLTYDVSGQLSKISLYEQDEMKSSRDPVMPEVIDEDSVKIQGFEEAEFAAGPDGWMVFLRNTLEYPLWAKRLGIQGEVYFQALITREGRIADVRITESPDKILSDEAIRVMRKSTLWNPAKINGEAVDAYKDMMFTFKLKN